MTDNDWRPGDSMTGESASDAGGAVLLPCECGGSAQMRGSRDGDVDWYQCRRCKRESKCSISRTEAIHNWNTRTPAEARTLAPRDGWREALERIAAFPMPPTESYRVAREALAAAPSAEVPA